MQEEYEKIEEKYEKMKNKSTLINKIIESGINPKDNICHIYNPGNEFLLTIWKKREKIKK